MKELREYLEQYADEDSVRFFTEKGTKEFQSVTLIQDETFYRHVAIIEVD